MEKEILLVNIEPGSGILATYKNQPYKLEGAFAEFIDNSTQSFFVNREKLKELGQSTCKITIEIFPEYIRIVDDAFGMDEKDFRRALKLNSPPEDKSGRCEKGMGLKTAATCLGSLWSVETTMYGSTKKYKCTVDVDEVEVNSPESIEATVETCSSEEHYTIIEIKNLNKKITQNKILKLIAALSQIYSKDLSNKDLLMSINKMPVKYTEPELRTDPETGEAYFRLFERAFEVDGQTYSFDGWVGIRKTGDTEFSGFTLFRRGRAIKMYYRPTQLLGKPNLYPYQRIVGEVNLLGDNWAPSYTKDELMWEGELEEKFISELKEASIEMITLSSQLRKEEKPLTKEKQRNITANLNKSFSSQDEKGIEININSEEIETKEVSEQETIKEEKAEVEQLEKTLTEIKDDEPERVEIIISGVKQNFWVKLLNNEHQDWLKLNLRNEENQFDLTINYGLPYFGVVSKNQKEIELIQKMAITFASSIISAKNSGDKEAYRTLQIMNSIIRSVK